MILKKIALLILLFIMFFLFRSEKNTLIFKDKNAYDHPVWEDMLEEKTVNLSDLNAAFIAYSSTHNLDNLTLNKFNELKEKFEGLTDINGNFKTIGLSWHFYYKTTIFICYSS